MKPIAILHYRAAFARGRPAYVVLMSDGHRCLSHRHVCIRDTPENRADAAAELGFSVGHWRSLLAAPGLSLAELTDGRDLFHGAGDLLTEPADTPNLRRAGFMYTKCTNLAHPADTPLLIYGWSTYSGCTNLAHPADTPLLNSGAWMYQRCTSLTHPADTPLLRYGFGMYRGCTNLARPADTPLLEEAYAMYRGCKFDQPQQETTK